MNQIIMIKEIKGFSRVGAKVGWSVCGGGGLPRSAGGVTQSETGLSGGAVWGGPGGLS